MSQTDYGIETIDMGFRPSLSRHITGDYAKFAYRFGMDHTGQPAPSLNGDRAAVWNTQIPNHLGELGVLAVSVPAESFLAPLYRHWYCGVIPQEAYDLAQHEPEDEHSLARTLLEFANFGPNILATDCYSPGAFNLLQTMYRK